MFVATIWSITMNAMYLYFKQANYDYISNKVGNKKSCAWVLKFMLVNKDFYGASGWPAAVLPTNQVPVWISVFTNMDFNMIISQ